MAIDPDKLALIYAQAEMLKTTIGATDELSDPNDMVLIDTGIHLAVAALNSVLEDAEEELPNGE